MDVAEAREEEIPEPEIEVVAEIAVCGFPVERVPCRFLAYREILATASSTALRRILGRAMPIPPEDRAAAPCAGAPAAPAPTAPAAAQSACRPRSRRCLRACAENGPPAVERDPGVELLLQEQRRIAVDAVEDVDAFAAHRAGLAAG